jgi:hypothetical protein
MRLVVLQYSADLLKHLTDNDWFMFMACSASFCLYEFVLQLMSRLGA